MPSDIVRGASAPDDPAFLPASALLELFRTGRVSPVEVVRAALDRIEAYGGAVNAFAFLDREGALRAARLAEERWRLGRPAGMLDGIPLSVKDNIHVAGLPTRQGSRALDAAPAAEDASAVAAVRRHGAVILGKTTMPEFGLGPVTISPLTGITRNPWNLAMSAGGSSGGSAAAVAAGMGTLAIGGDAGGSIRIPAAFNGIVGLKPSYGRVPAYPFTGMPFVSCVGPLARSVEDTALLLNVLAAPDPRDMQALPPEETDYRAALRRGIAGKRIAFSTTLGYARNVDDEVRLAVETAARGFAELGAAVEPADPGFANPLATNLTLMTAVIARRTAAFTPEQQERLGERVRAAAERGRRLSAVEYVEAMEQRLALASSLQRFHQTYDLLLTPTVSVPAFPAERWAPEAFDRPGEERAWVPFTSPFNLTQQPAVSVPCGCTKAGLPIGLQIVGRYREDALVLAAAYAFEQVRPPIDLTPA